MENIVNVPKHFLDAIIQCVRCVHPESQAGLACEAI